jgi:hypothetical protein
VNLAEATTSIPRKKSKISIKMDELKNKSEDEEYYKELNDGNEFDEFENEFDSNSKKINLAKNNEDKYAKFNTYFYFKLNENNEFNFPIQTDIFNKSKQYVYELIKNIIKKINEKNLVINYNNIDYIVSLKDTEEEDINFYIKNYELKPCKKKNFKPKNDCPSFSPNSLLENVDNKLISFISKNSLNLMLRERIEENNKYQYDDDEDW